MPAEFFTDVHTWVFDLDNTLYPPETRLFDQIELRMVNYVMDTLGVTQPEANQLRRKYWMQYGTTLAGLMQDHGIDPVPYMQHVHDIDFTVLRPDAHLRDQIAALPGRRIIYTNGSADYAQRVTEARGLNGLFDAIYGVEHAGYRPKPEQSAFEQVFALDGLDTARAAMFEDDPRNLAAPFDMGMRTVHVAPHPYAAPHIQHHTNDLATFLSHLRP
jgi:putative hydrolase of the HAD superfamily